MISDAEKKMGSWFLEIVCDNTENKTKGEIVRLPVNVRGIDDYEKALKKAEELFKYCISESKSKPEFHLKNIRENPGIIFRRSLWNKTADGDLEILFP